MIRIFGILLFSSFAFAQNIDVKDIKSDDKTTTIEIRKGDKAASRPEIQWEVVEGHADISGEHNPVRKEARSEWKKACESWRKEFRDENKENKIINMTCGTPACVNETDGTQCKSQASYKIKTRIN